METLPAPTPSADLAHLQTLWERAEDLVAASRAESTRLAYADDWRRFTAWATSTGLPAEVPVNPRTLLLYLADHGHLKSSTLGRYLSAIKYTHTEAGELSPTDHPQVRLALAGHTRERADTTRQAKPLFLEDVGAAVAGLNGGTKGHRDRALLLTGWWGALRRSELVALNAGDVDDHPQGAVLHLRRSKTDQEAKGRKVPLHYRQDEALCPVRALRGWLNTAGITRGAVFRRVDRWGNLRPGRLQGRAVAEVVKSAAVRIGLDPIGYSAHSLRAGFVSECDRRGIGSSAVRVVTGHQSDAMLAVYTRPRDLFESSAGAFYDD